MNSPKHMGFERYRLHRFAALGLFSNPHNTEVSKTFGRPIKKLSRVGKSKLNKVGHRNNRG